MAKKLFGILNEIVPDGTVMHSKDTLASLPTNNAVVDSRLLPGILTVRP